MIPDRDFRLEALATWLEVRREVFEGRPLAADVRSILEEVRRLRAAAKGDHEA